MDRHTIRYMFEHRLLPEWFFEDKEQIVLPLLKDKGILFEVIDEIFRKEKVENPYSPEQFEVEPSKLTEEVFVVKIIYPEPEEEPLCYRSYLFFDLAFEKTAFFCIEKGGSLSDALPFVCAWTKDGAHKNYGNCTFDEHESFLKCASIYMRNEYGMEPGGRQGD